MPLRNSYVNDDGVLARRELFTAALELPDEQLDVCLNTGDAAATHCRSIVRAVARKRTGFVPRERR